MSRYKIEIENKSIRLVTNISILVNISLTVAKIAIGSITGSMAVVSDGIHSLSDMVTDLAVIFGVHFGSKGPDIKHPYGHGRIETFAGTFVAAALIIVGLGMVYYAGKSMVKGSVVVPTVPMFVVTILSIVSKEWLYQITKKVAIKSHSSATYANAWHHRSDALSSIAVLVGIAALKLGFAYGDQVAAITVGLMVILVGIQVLGDCLTELTESAVDRSTIEQIQRIINANSSIRHWHELRTRMVGREIFLDLHILVDPDLDIASAHEISEMLEKAMHEQMTRPVNITVHIEPDIPSLRR